MYGDSDVEPMYCETVKDILLTDLCRSMYGEIAMETENTWHM